MTDTIDSRLKNLGISIPEAAAPAANYVPFAQSGSLLLTSGQLPLEGGKLVHTGQIGDELTVAHGQAAARACAINILAQAKAALGDLGRIKRVVKITTFVASTPDFVEQHLVANGASDLLVAVLGDAGKHARSAVGVASLPLNAPVEIEAIIEVA
ncbi:MULTISPECIES: RidA family protein [Brucella/Ochrobactrum group]|jgi:enamine deaminase RidA (YjgF/YER057c/UK114 family)|uniref:RidA family protein n=1 Tax=Brucella pseudintermedia TaxID=370111 RepID=A0ABY5UBY4_9HYPH|nr:MULTISPECIES: RidA family protein [Brucella/Ochrobactrum group]KAB2683926.1 RidA family protein [Brucella pseudintermedia]MCO7727710.1 RidA family protein [Brucella intermedia]NKE77110.1 RidA family protein [Ochrobactrum sp. MC-1LL]TWH03777.1 enamine deaminase RidA (YjgF/YER057c/UK114 family) [Ochrobactrum sp. J50]UWL60843.1 RidA family protein [Brucella pseudintermedia]